MEVWFLVIVLLHRSQVHMTGACVDLPGFDWSSPMASRAIHPTGTENRGGQKKE